MSVIDFNQAKDFVIKNVPSEEMSSYNEYCLKAYETLSLFYKDEIDNILKRNSLTGLESKIDLFLEPFVLSGISYEIFSELGIIQISTSEGLAHRKLVYPSGLVPNHLEQLDKIILTGFYCSIFDKHNIYLAMIS